MVTFLTFINDPVFDILVSPDIRACFTTWDAFFNNKILYRWNVLH
jgi:hypothetical protein